MHSGGNPVSDEMEEKWITMLKVKNEDGIEALNKEWKEFIAEIPLEGPDAHFKRGYQAIMRGEVLKSDDPEEQKKAVERALDDLNIAIEEGIEDPRAWHARAIVSVLRQNWKGARKDLEQAAERDPLNAWWIWRLPARFNYA